MSIPVEIPNDHGLIKRLRLDESYSRSRGCDAAIHPVLEGSVAFVQAHAKGCQQVNEIGKAVPIPILHHGWPPGAFGIASAKMEVPVGVSEEHGRPSRINEAGDKIQFSIPIQIGDRLT